jgi:hypothetical protein
VNRGYKRRSPRSRLGTIKLFTPHIPAYESEELGVQLDITQAGLQYGCLRRRPPTMWHFLFLLVIRFWSSPVYLCESCLRKTTSKVIPSLIGSVRALRSRQFDSQSQPYMSHASFPAIVIIASSSICESCWQISASELCIMNLNSAIRRRRLRMRIDKLRTWLRSFAADSGVSDEAVDEAESWRSTRLCSLSMSLQSTI